MDAGIYRDFKGNYVRVLPLNPAKHTETGEPMVMFMPLSGPDAALVMACPETVFTENVEVGTNAFVPRYEFVGEEIPR